MTSRSLLRGDLRQDFPALSRPANPGPYVYLDAAATSLQPTPVLEAVEQYQRHLGASIHRGHYGAAEEATAAYESARDQLARFLGAPSRRGVIFTRGATEAINLVAHAWARTHLRPGDEILTSPLEHHSNLVPWQLAAEATGSRLVFAELDAQGRLLPESVEQGLSASTRLVTMTHVSNVLGTIQPVGEIVSLAHERGIRVLVDGAQAAGHLPLDLTELDADFYCVSGHKMFGPTGSGALIASPEILDSMPPFLAGGGMIETVDRQSSTWNELPWKFEAGTPDVGAAIGLGAATGYLTDLGMAPVREHETSRLEQAWSALAAMDGVTLYGPEPGQAKRIGILIFNVRGIRSHDLAMLLDTQGFAVRAGHHCAIPLADHLGIDSSCRISLAAYTRPDDIDRFTLCLAEIARSVGGHASTSSQPADILPPGLSE